MTAFHHTQEARQALADAKASKTPAEQTAALQRGLAALIDAIARLNSDEERTHREIERRTRGIPLSEVTGGR